MRYLLGSLVLIFGLYVGCSTAFKSWQGTFFVSNSKYIAIRNPAYVQKYAEFSELKGKAWNLLSRERLLAEAFPIREPDRTGLVFGHFITQDDLGKKYFACDLYNKIELTFVAEGITESGETTLMKVQAPCRAKADLNTLETVWIPQKEILSQTPSPSLKFDFASTDVHVSFTNLTSQWPRQWILEDIKLVQDLNVIPSLDIDAQEITRSAKSPMNLIW